MDGKDLVSQQVMVSYLCIRAFLSKGATTIQLSASIEAPQESAASINAKDVMCNSWFSRLLQ